MPPACAWSACPRSGAGGQTARENRAKAAFSSRHFAGNGAGRIGALGNGIERLAGESVKHVKPALFGGLGNGLDGLAAAPHRK